MDEKKKKIIELMLKLDLRVNEYKKINKKYEEEKDKMSKEQLKKVETMFKEILKDITDINEQLKKLNKE